MKKGYIYSIISAILFGSAGIIIKFAFKEGVDSVSLLTLQYIIAIVFMFMIISFKDIKLLKVSRTQLFRTAVLGILGNTFMTVFYYMAFSKLSVAMVAILLYTYPIIVLIYSLIFEGKRLEPYKFLAVLLAFTGCIFALKLNYGLGSINTLGLIYGLLSACFYAFMNIYSEKKLLQLNSITTNFYATLFSLISLLIYKPDLAGIYSLLNFRIFVSTTLLAVMCEIIPLTLLYAAIKKIGAVKVSIIGNLEIPTAMILSVLFLNESLGIFQVCGAALVIYAVLLVKK